MSVTTPTKASEPLMNFSPVSLPRSPAALAGQQNLTGLPRVVRDLAADLYNTIQKWNDSHIKGAILVKNIALLKTDSSEKFPEGLDEMFVSLQDVYKKLEAYAKTITVLADRMASMVKLKSNESKLFSMTSGQISDIISEIAKAYSSELTRKQYVFSNIAHSRTKDEAMYYVASWVHPQYISDNIKVKLEALLIETGHREIK